MSSVRKKALKKFDFISIEELYCGMCDHHYASVKSMYHHVRTQHTSSRTFYPCLFCKSVFTAVWGVTRHIERVHNKTKVQADKFKDKIRSKSFQRKVKPINKLSSLNKTSKSCEMEVNGDIDNSLKTPKTENNSLPTHMTSHQKVTVPRDQIITVIPVPCGDIESSMKRTYSSSPPAKKMKIEDRENFIQPQEKHPLKSVTARQKLIEESKREYDKNIAANTELSMFKCEICQKAFFKQDSYLRHSSFCVFDEDRIEIESSSTRSREALKKQPTPVKLKFKNIDSKEPSEVLSTNKKNTADDTKSKDKSKSTNGDITYDKNVGEQKLDVKKAKAYGDSVSSANKTSDFCSKNKINDRKTRSKTGSLTPKVFPDSVELTNTQKKIFPMDPAVPPKKTIPEIVVEDESSHHYRYYDLTDEEIKQIREVINTEKVQCLKCNQKYTNVSSLHRHVVRHFGWKRFKCFYCNYTAFHRSECYTHLRRTHSSELVNDSKNVEQLVLPLSPEQKKQEKLSGHKRVDNNKNSPPALAVVDLSVDTIRRQPPRLSPVKSPSISPPEVTTVAKNKSRKLSLDLKQEVKKECKVAPKITKRRCRANTHDGITLKGKPMVVKTMPSTSTNYKSNTSRSKPTGIQKYSKTLSNPLMWKTSNGGTKGLLVNKSPPSQKLSTSMSRHSLREAKLVGKSGKHTDVFLLVVDESKSQTISPNKQPNAQTPSNVRTPPNVRTPSSVRSPNNIRTIPSVKTSPGVKSSSNNVIVVKSGERLTKTPAKIVTMTTISSKKC